MAGGQLDCVLCHIRRLIRVPSAGDLTDGQLLERFVTRHDEAAFEALLQRHGRLVLGVCRRVLHDCHAADDAFQATFLVLARKAASIRKQKSIGSWLYGVAYRLAVRAKVDAARRREYERQVEPMPTSDPMTEVVQRDLRPVLDEELGHLPEKYRVPLVLCYLQGKTNEQAARELGWPPGTMSRRLARARELLRIRLTGRGVTLSTALLLTALAEEASAVTVPAALLHSTLPAALLFVAGQAAPAGVISGQALVLAEGALKAMWITKLKIATALFLAVSLVGSGAGILTHQVLAARPIGAKMDSASQLAATDQERDREVHKPVRADNPAELDPTSEATPRPLSVSGKVIDFSGKPVADATVHLREGASDPAILTTRKVISATTSTDHQGQFVFKDVPGLDTSPRYRDIVVMAKGHGLAFETWQPQEQPQSCLLRLAPEAKLQGRLLDPDGKPIAGAHVELVQLLPLQGPVWVPLITQLPLSIRTDPSGAFLLDGLPRNLRVTLAISADGFARRLIYAATTDQLQPRFPMRNPTIGGKQVRFLETVHPSRFTLVLRPGNLLRGQVLLEDTGKPASGARLSFQPVNQPARYPYTMQTFAVTDREGRYAVHLPESDEYRLNLVPPENSDYVVVNTEVDLSAGQPEVEKNWKLPRGVVVTGRVVDGENGKGIVRASVAYEPQPPPPRPPEGLFPLPLPRLSAKTGPDGHFRMVVPAGKGRLCIAGSVPGYATSGRVFAATQAGTDGPFVRNVELTPGKPPSDVRFTLDRGMVVRCRVLDPDGKVVPGAQVESAYGSYPESLPFADAEGQITLSGLGGTPGAKNEFLITEPKRRLAAVLSIPASQDKQSVLREVRLGPAAGLAGQVLDEDKKPIPGASVSVHPWTRMQGGPGSVVQWDFGSKARRTADSAGKFSFDTLLPGPNYVLEVSAEGYLGYAHQFEAKPGQLHRVSDLVLQKTDQSIAGVVVDPSGRPLVGNPVQVEGVRMLGNFPAVRGDGGEAVTDQHGRFHITGLPKELLWVVVPEWHTGISDPTKPTDPSMRMVNNMIPTRLLARVQVQAGAQDVRIVVQENSGNRPADERVSKPARSFP